MNEVPKIIVALDYDNKEDALALVSQFEPGQCNFKVGKTLFTRCGPELVSAIIQKGFKVFLDLKFHDIPKQVAGACRAAADMGVWMLSVHVAGGLAMLQAARKALQTYENPPILVGITVLTSLDKKALQEIGFQETVLEHVTQLAKLAQLAKCDGVVCSAQEVSELRKAVSEKFCLVTPGIRPAGTEKGDQQRVMTPEEAIEAGVNYLVIGRPITESDDPQATLQKITQSISRISA